MFAALLRSGVLVSEKFHVASGLEDGGWCLPVHLDPSLSTHPSFHDSGDSGWPGQQLPAPEPASSLASWPGGRTEIPFRGSFLKLSGVSLMLCISEAPWAALQNV